MCVMYVVVFLEYRYEEKMNEYEQKTKKDIIPFFPKQNIKDTNYK